MRVRYTPLALLDLEAIYAYLDERSSSAARKVKTAIEQKISALADFPLMAPQTDETGIRELSIVRYPYKVYYEVSGEEIWILHVRDARRRPWPDDN